MEIKKLVLGVCITNCYVVALGQKNCVIIDLADEAQGTEDHRKNFPNIC